MGLELNRTHKLLVYADNVNLLGDKIDTTKKNTQTLIDASTKVVIEINTEKTVAVSSPECRANHDVKIANSWCENVARFRCLGTTIRNQNLIQEEIKKRLNSSNACYNSVRNLLSFHLLSEKN
jgi:hypothetical protein